MISSVFPHSSIFTFSLTSYIIVSDGFPCYFYSSSIHAITNFFSLWLVVLVASHCAQLGFKCPAYCISPSCVPCVVSFSSFVGSDQGSLLVMFKDHEMWQLNQFQTCASQVSYSLYSLATEPCFKRIKPVACLAHGQLRFNPWNPYSPLTSTTRSSPEQRVMSKPCVQPDTVPKSSK